MGQQRRRGMSALETAELLTRLKAGESLTAIGRALGRHVGSVYAVVRAQGGIAPAVRRRAAAALTLEEREAISRGLASGESVCAKAQPLGRAPLRRMCRIQIVHAYRVLFAVSIAADVASAQLTEPDSAATGKGRGPLMVELSAGRTKMPGISYGGGPATVAAGIGTGKWFADRVMLGLEARAHGTIDIEASVPSVRFVSSVVAIRRTPGEPVLRLAAGPAWVASPNARAVRTFGLAASLEIPFEPDLQQASWVVFMRYSGTGTVLTPPARSVPFRTTQLAVGIRLEL